MMLELAFLLIPLLPFIIIRFGRYWRATIMVLMIYMVFEGAFRKWLFPSWHAQIYILKDVILAFSVCGFMLERHLSGPHEGLMSSLRWLTVGCMLYCFVQLVNPNNPSPLVWAIGFKSYFLYVALLFMVPYIFTSAEDMERKLKLYMLVMIPVALMGLVQFVMPRDHWINAQLAHDIETQLQASAFGADQRARSTGTFSYIGGFATFLPAMLALSIATLIGGRTTAFRNYVPLAMITACALAMFTTGSRLVVLSAAVIAAVIILLSMLARLITTVTALRAFIASSVVSFIVWQISGEAFDAFVHRTENSDDPVVRLLSPFIEVVNAFSTSPLFGTGLGTAHNSTAVIMRAPDMYWLHGHHYELETARVMQEIGLIGFTLVYLPRIILIYIAAKLAFRLRTPLYKALSLAIAAYFIPQLFLFVINNPTGGLYYWFFAGLLFGMYRLEYQAAEAKYGAAAPISPAQLQGRGLAAAARTYRQR